MSVGAATPQPDAFEIRTNATFEALMWALSRLGSLQHLPSPDVATIGEALIDRECRVFSDDPGLVGSLVASARTRCRWPEPTTRSWHWPIQRGWNGLRKCRSGPTSTPTRARR